MNTIDKVRAILAEASATSFEVAEKRVTVHPVNEDGFEVSLVVRDQGYAVYFEGWHEEFASEVEALKCFVFGLSKRCRLKVHRRGETPYKWTVEGVEEGVWKEDSTVGLFFFPFWRNAEVIYLQNKLMDMN